MQGGLLRKAALFIHNSFISKLHTYIVFRLPTILSNKILLHATKINCSRTALEQKCYVLIFINESVRRANCFLSKADQRLVPFNTSIDLPFQGEAQMKAICLSN